MFRCGYTLFQSTCVGCVSPILGRIEFEIHPPVTLMSQLLIWHDINFRNNILEAKPTQAKVLDATKISIYIEFVNPVSVLWILV